MIQTSMIKRSAEAKKSAATAVIAMKIAKDAGDPLQKKAARFKAFFVAAKEAINKKYGNRARAEWSKKQGQNDK